MTQLSMIPTRPTPPLSKTRFMGGLQCLKRLFLESYYPKLIPPTPPSQQALFDSGSRIGELARNLYPGGRLIEEKAYEHARAVSRTQQVVADESVPAIYEAAFFQDGIRIRVDILNRLSPSTFALAEVKSSTSVKAEHIPDAAVQVHVAERSGPSIQEVYLVHINNTYVYKGGPYELDKLFQVEDVTAPVRTYLSRAFPRELMRMQEALAESTAPQVEISRHCSQPYECPFYAHCRQDTPEHHIEQLPNARADVIAALRSAGISDIRDIPRSFDHLSLLQQRVRDSVVSGDAYVGMELDPALSSVEYPLLFVDFETFNPALPLYQDTRPYQVIPFQWSVHTQSEDGSLTHQAFLHNGTDDPRLAFVKSLLEAAGTSGSIVVYSSYEEAMLKQLATQLPEYADRLLALARRIFDLLKPLRAHYYHPDFHGSFSLKSVLPVLAPDLGYGDLEIQEGSLASVAYAKMLTLDSEDADRDEIRASLLDYCERDTEAMVRVYATLRSATTRS